MTQTGHNLVVTLDGSVTLSREDIGGKAWSINRMRALGLPVPPAVVATTENCRDYYASGRQLSDELWQQITSAMRLLEEATGRRFGSPAKPLLVSVRSGAARSMPGMMDTVLDLGINAEIEAGLAAETGDAAYAADTHRRFVEAYRHVVLGDTAGGVPEDPWHQLRGAVEAVFASWNSPRALAYRRSRGLSDEGGTAVTIQAMVFGNLDDRSGTGVLFTRDPRTGERNPFGEWLPRGQGEDVVSGRADPQPLDALRESLPDVHAHLLDVADQVERDSGDIQDVEFTVQSGRLWLLQSRAAKRSPRAAVHAAVTMVDEGILVPDAALARVSAEQVRALLTPTLDRSRLAEADRVAVGLPVCEGVATGVVVLDPDEAERRADAGEDVILARAITSPDDMHGLLAARAVITEHGGSTSHAAVVSRELGRVCVVGCGERSVTSLSDRRVTVDGGSGEVWLGETALVGVKEEDDPDLARLIGWAEERVRQGARPRVSPRLPALLEALQDRRRDDPQPDRSATGDEDVDELSVLRLIGLKGRAPVAALTHSSGASDDVLTERITALTEAGLCKQGGAGLRLTPEGRERLSSLLNAETARTDQAAAAKIYARFCELNGDLKEIITDWQLREGTTPNDHSDPAYDNGILARLADLYERVRPVLDDVGAVSPRLRRYARRFAVAHQRIAEGDHSFVATIGKDSFHTIWFELHEDLISITGATRAQEAAAGRAL